MWSSNILLHRPGASKLINLIPHHNTRITRFYATKIDSELIIPWVEPNPERIPHHHEGKAEGLVDSDNPPKAVCPTVLLEWLEDSRLCSIRLCLIKTEDVEATQCIPDVSLDNHYGAHMPVTGMLQWAAVMQTPMFEPHK